jgi:alcohol dehydrogenase
MMKALVYGGPGVRTWQEMPKPVIRDPGDAVVRITTTTICGNGPAHPEG